MDCIKERVVLFILDFYVRFFYGYGYICYEIFEFCYGMFYRIFDIVIWLSCYKDVEEIVWLVVEYNVCIILFGGGISVFNVFECLVIEKRMIVFLDMIEMKKILWVDEENLVVYIEVGIIG